MDVQPHLLNLSAYINQNLEKDLPLSSLAKRVGLSPFHFHRKFGAYFGESLHQHIKRLRLERAAFALTHGAQPVRQIARESGYKTVSAFSHAFSGFAGESPTRYRSQGAPVADGTKAAELEPAWIGDLAPQDIAFVRAIGSFDGAHTTVQAAIDLIRARLELAHGVDGDGPPSLEIVAATSDVYGISKQQAFRVDVGIDKEGVPHERAGVLGNQTLPGGRYARFDLQCRASDVVGAAGGISLTALRERGEAPRLTQYFVRFTADGQDDPDTVRTYRLFVPLLG